MSEERSSYAILAEQPELFAAGELPAGEEILEPDQSRFTAEQVRRNGARFSLIVAMLAEGRGTLEICRVARCSAHTVYAVRDRHPGLVAREKELLAGKIRTALHLSLETFIGGLERGEIKPGQLAVPIGILTDKLQLLQGDPTSRVEVVAGEDLSENRLRGRFEALKRAAIEAEIVGAGDGQAEAKVRGEQHQLAEVVGLQGGSSDAESEGGQEGGGRGGEGGGSASARGGGFDDGLGAQNLGPKGPVAGGKEGV